MSAPPATRCSSDLDHAPMLNGRCALCGADLALAAGERPRPLLPPNLPPKLQALMLVHLRVTSRRWQQRRAAPDGTWFHQGETVLRLRTELLEPVPLGRTPR